MTFGFECSIGHETHKNMLHPCILVIMVSEYQLLTTKYFFSAEAIFWLSEAYRVSDSYRVVHNVLKYFLLGAFLFSCLFIFTLHSKEFARNQGKHKKWVPSILSHNLWLIFMGMKQKILFEKTEIFKNFRFSIFFVEILEICPCVSRINWCKGHWYGSTCMVRRWSDASSKIGKKH